MPSGRLRPPSFSTRGLCIACAATVLALAPIAGAADDPDPGFVPIFDGVSLTGWEGKPEC